MKRVFFLVPDLKMASSINQELHTLGITDSDVHVVGGAGDALEQAHIHRASILQTSDIVPALKRGIFLGLGLSVFIYILFYFALPSSVKFNLTALMAMFLFGLAFGLWATGMIGIGIKNPIVQKYDKYIKDGHFIMMIDFPTGKEKALSELIIKHHPEAKIAGIDVKAAAPGSIY